MKRPNRFPCPGQAGFTVLELLVASLLLSMLVTVLTMIFNQSSISWRTGVASVNDLQDTREKMGAYHDIMDDALPGIGQRNASDVRNRNIDYRTISLFRNWKGSGNISATTPNGVAAGRLIDRIKTGSAGISTLNSGTAVNGATITGLGQGTYGKGAGGFLVGVRSAGPNRQMGDEDDIDTFPEDIN